MSTATRFCADCEHPISEIRLRAVPNTEYCINCQPLHDDLATAIHHVAAREDEVDATNFVIERRSRTQRSERWDDTSY